MEKDVKIFFEDLLKKTNLSGSAEVAVDTTSNSNQIFVDIDYPMPAPDEHRGNRRSAYLKFIFHSSYFQKRSIKDIPGDKILETIHNFDFERTTSNKNKHYGERPHEIWLINEDNELSREEIIPKN